MASGPNRDSVPGGSKAPAPDPVKEDFGYLDLPQDRKEGWMVQEGFSEKFKRKTRANPFVPIGRSLMLHAIKNNNLISRQASINRQQVCVFARDIEGAEVG